MILTKIHVSNHNTGSQPPIHRKLENAPNNVLILVPDMESFHELSGLAFLLDKDWVIHYLEPGTPISWQGMYSPWHLNTDSYRLTFDDFLPTYVER